MCIIGDNEVANNSITVRKRNGDNIGEKSVDELISFLKEEISTRR